jgi:hypothetical protein
MEHRKRHGMQHKMTQSVIVKLAVRNPGISKMKEQDSRIISEPVFVDTDNGPILGTRTRFVKSGAWKTTISGSLN